MLRNKKKNEKEETRFAFPNVTSNAIIHVPFYYELYYTENEREGTKQKI